ncbi:MAG: sigma 54-interacting transcriptional regulator [Nitrospinae bacterium]|nr:sigma 54-interacting transcriptional regulator [Nitrospinota bacterium]
MVRDLEILSQQVQRFGKENLSDILHYTAVGLKSVFGCHMVRIYLEDLHQGMLICQYVTGQKRPDERQITQFISPRDSITSQAFYENEVVRSWTLPEGFIKFRNPFEKISGIKASVVFPIVHELRPIGTLTMDWQEEGEFLTLEQVEAVNGFLGGISAVVDRAKRFNQQISFSRLLDLARKKEAAWMMMRSAVKLIDKLSLASVLVPASTKIAKPGSKKPTDLVEVMAVYSKNQEDASIYLNKDQMSVLNEENLINRIVEYDAARGLMMRKLDQQPVYIENIMEESFARKKIIQQLGMVSLYQIPKYDRETGQFICAVNYYSSEAHRFSAFEKRLLEEHAAMVENRIAGDSSEHIEIQVLGEIEELLSEKDDSLPAFLHKILDKISELLGADSGTISILKVIDGKPWLVVENADGSLLGAKSRGWTKSQIPPLPVGGEDLPDNMKSLNGYCAHGARPILIRNVMDRSLTQGFYKNLSSSVQSELAAPIIYGNSVIGVINQDSFREHYFTEEHKRILQIIASLISQKVHNLNQIQELRQEITQLRQDVEYRDPKVSSYYFGNVIGRSDTIHNLVDRINTVVESVCNRMLQWDSAQTKEAMMGLPALLVHGETGTGKEFFFNNIYARITEIFQREKGKNFKLMLRKTNIAAYSGELTYSELFGHKKGAYTGAEFNRQGILEEANGGVVFLDEIGDADPKTQVQLLRFLDTGVFMRLGENEPRYSRIFLIAATNKNLREEIEQGRFREDLYHRLSALSFRIPSLNERREDIADLATHFLGILFHTYKKGHAEETLPQLEKPAIDHLIRHNYRGNVRELKNILMRAMMFRKGSVITASDVIAACEVEPSGKSAFGRPASTVHVAPDFAESILDRLETGEGDFWSQIHQPFKRNRLTRDTVKQVIEAARLRYRANLPGLAVKLGVCSEQFQHDPAEMKKFTSFKNFLYKTVKISTPN